MILNNPDNRKLVTEYLNSLSEDKLIEEFIVPIFSRYGYRVVRIVQHGPGEHGKDVVFAKFDPLHMAEEVIAVQAKAEKVTAGNLDKFTGQINRAMRIGFPSAVGGVIRPHYVFFINSQTHTNDAHTGFLQMVDEPIHTRIFSQENLCDLILQSGVAPQELLKTLSIASPVNEGDINSYILKTLREDQPRAVDHLLDHELKLLRKEVAPRMKQMIIEFANKKWDEDPSWSGTVRPMRWFNEYFDFFDPSQYCYLMKILREYTSSSYSFDADHSTGAVVRKITPQHVKDIADSFLRLAVSVTLNKSRNGSEVVELARQALRENTIKNPHLTQLVQYVDERKKPNETRDSALLSKLREELTAFIDTP